MQVDTKTISSKESLRLVSRIYHQQGLKGFYRGYWITLGVFIPQTVIYFVSYEQLKNVAHYSNYIPPYVGYLASAGIASVFSSSISNVLDVIKTRVQVADGASVGSVARELYLKEGGLKAFTRGMGARVMSIVPSTMISFTIFEVLKDWSVEKKN
ncbi:hypothetical protein HDU83_000157 [Entophlyctis luteolus]|nr:hypothetical protein HDU83_000157 [Entophlyctis luteolus]KAJ3394204.1 hypothetical protein HDU84_009524 [Entophlyctis sp. JEL0112]